ncbi:polysialyltransferase family glycosyltransferase [Thiomicrospira cyclica]|uniref:Uncharacterized protein n=1 Tax=Thiomicrospira cyclica (strain DSM 14477 / JCM 11371 / ALM1) TaxID=717773 RepID=F6DCX2_THICA|nr:polysialyltransferase family glycosyltransferase [Thiomicrospira cyclica]AEG31708.1 hypothetical protein Thicy_0941 [Thiomicrospira cyclica ALM1]
MAKVLFFPSTPLNILVSAALACHLRQQHGDSFQAEIWLIDQKNTDNNPYLNALEQWSDSPFKRVTCLPGKAKGRAKLRERKQNFHAIQQDLAEFQPDIIATGSDRRIEFQYAMHLMKQTNKQINMSDCKPTQGWYLDDGLYSYAGWPVQPGKDQVNAWLKKLTYGLWWQEPKTIGASSWINQAWLFQPQQAHPLLQHKRLYTLKTDWFQTPAIRALCRHITKQLPRQELSAISLLLLLPHPADQAKMLDYVQQIRRYLDKITEQGVKVAVKYHPRQAVDDEHQLAKNPAVTIIPKDVAFEYLLADLPPNTQVVGDISTVLLTAKWLRDDVGVTGVFNADDAYAQQFKPYFAQFGIHIIEDLTKLPIHVSR